ncbi:MAG: adenylate kinase [Verrucomicrobia bacterium]|nr:adenylate kinase [Verrucomicrobiota bacterium]
MYRSSTPKPLVVILLGPPGAGKGTHASPMSQQLGIPHISTGDLFRENIRGQTALGKKAKEYMDQGKLVPDELVLDMLFDRIARDDCKSGYILDGFPRTLAQAKALDARLNSHNQVVAINFDVPDAVLVKRIAGRMLCKSCARPYHREFQPPAAENICDTCGGSLYQRDDDKAEVVVKRLEVYHEQTQPVIDYFAAKKGSFHQINSQNPPAQVFHEAMEVLPVPAVK